MVGDFIERWEIFNYLVIKEIGWKFNMFCVLWWGGFFERLIGMMKNVFFKVIGWVLLRFEEFEEVLLYVELFLNNRFFCYIGEEFEILVIILNLLLCGELVFYFEENCDEVVV